MWVICLPGFNIFSEVWSVSILLEHVRLPELISDCTRELNPNTLPVIRPSHLRVDEIGTLTPWQSRALLRLNSTHARQPTLTNIWKWGGQLRKKLKCISAINAVLCETPFHRFGVPLFFNWVVISLSEPGCHAYEQGNMSNDLHLLSIVHFNVAPPVCVPQAVRILSVLCCRLIVSVV